MTFEPGDWFEFRPGAVSNWTHQKYSGQEGDRYRLRYDPDNSPHNAELALYDTVLNYDLYSEAYAVEDRTLLRAMQGMVLELNRLAKLLESHGIKEVE